MGNILFINACVRPNSRTYKLANEILNKLSGTIKEINLEKENIQPLNWETLQLRETCCKKNDFSLPIFNYAKDFSKADDILIAAPFWDLSFPATIKTYFEAVTIRGLTFKYTEEGFPTGLCNAKRIIYVTTAGGSIGNFNFGFDYIKELATKFYGIKDLLYYKVENLDVVGNDSNAIINKAINEIKNNEFNNNHIYC